MEDIKVCYFMVDEINCWICIPEGKSNVTSVPQLMSNDTAVPRLMQKSDTLSVIYLPAGGEITQSLPDILKEIKSQNIEDCYNTFIIAGFESVNWESDFTPWPAPSPFNKSEAFGGNAKMTLNWILNRYQPELERHFKLKNQINYYILGHSLGGLFALWAVSVSDMFHGCASCSGSLWYDGFMDFIKTRHFKNESRIYLSLGKNEEKARNAKIASVGNVTRETAELLGNNPNITDFTLQWQEGGHFNDMILRIAQAILWIVKKH